MKFSLIMPTLGRTRDVERWLAALDEQAYKNFELIVVDQNSDNRLAKLLAPYINTFPILHLRQTEKGAARARNIGLTCASGDIVAFPDDDCYYPPNTLERVARFFATHPEVDGLTGRSVDEDGKTTGPRFDTEPGYIHRVNLWRRAIEYTIFLRRDSIRGTWYDESLGTGAGTEFGSGEGAAYLLQLLDRGALLYYNPDLLVVHAPSVPPYDAEAVRKAYYYACGTGRVIRNGQYPLWFKVKTLVKPLGGAVLYLIQLRLSEAEFFWSTFKGRLKGLLP